MSQKRTAEMQKGDFKGAHQSGVGVVGLATLVSDGYKGSNSERFDSFDLSSTRFVLLVKPISWSEVRKLPKAQEDFEFARIHQGTDLGCVVRGSHA